VIICALYPIIWYTSKCFSQKKMKKKKGNSTGAYSKNLPKKTIHYEWKSAEPKIKISKNQD
jgi:hypothetical protein